MTDPRGDMDPLRQIRTLIAEPRNPHIDAWKESGKPVVGYFCAYTPPELLLAAGALPLRLRGTGSEDSALGDTYLSGRLCTFVRHVMSLVLDGRYDFLDGEVCLNTCDHVRRAADVFVKKSSIPFHGFLSVPRTPRDELLPYYKEELRKLWTQLCAHLGTPPSDDALRAAIAAYESVRDRLRKLESLRTGEGVRLRGAESLAVHVAAQSLPPDIFVPTADALLDALRARPPLPSPRARLVLIGAELDDPDYVDVIEATGALVVADELCFGSRWSVEPIEVDGGDPLDALARAYFFRRSCARMIGDFPNRFRTLERRVRESCADGVVFQRLLFCDPWGADQHNLMLRSRSGFSTPMLYLTREYGVVPKGQLRTRIQAFLERIETPNRARSHERAPA
ncbi:MAG: 2-hydroxyacyl-CoA dehydratase family protein [Polyangiaceae bacterium]|jgi:benzoyl-CoA reductase/2-hydroxyglutaryl-CoA dehydratase subunit BcrC/BadD/HgdB|nr:2-hydroxyacyl-CoA dehydratase family protein [Polyangiaceae bacterium]